MDLPQSPTGSLRRQHGRHISHPVMRRSSRGPLDAGDDPLAGPAASPSGASPSDRSSSTASAGAQQQPGTTAPSEPALASRTAAHVDLRFLQDPSIYHALPLDDLHHVFASSTQQPPRDMALPALLQAGHFRRAAGAAVDELLQCPSTDPARLLQLLYTRLACLVLLSRPDLAVAEAAPLTEMPSRNPAAAKDILAGVPWPLRLLLVRLQTIGAADGGRRGIMSLYSLAAEVRAHAKDAHASGHAGEHQLWADRLRDLGIRVADALVEMGELETANRHLDSLADADAGDIAYRKALLRLRVGDATGAQRSLQKITDERSRATLDALLTMMDGDYSEASRDWHTLIEEQPGNALAANNLAVSMLYTGHIGDARRVLEDLASHEPVFPGLLFNTSTVYELCTERAIDRKTELAQRVAAQTPAPDYGGWEKTNFDFKL